MSDIEYCPREVMLVEDARRALAEAKTLDEVKQVHDKAKAIRIYLRQQKAGLEAQNTAADITIRAGRRAGEMLSDSDLNSGGRPSENLLGSFTGFPPTLGELGITRHESSEWQRIAALPEPVFEEYIAETKASGKELTMAGVLKLAAKFAARQTIDQPSDSLCGGDIVGSLSVLIEAGRRFRTIYADPPWRYGNQATRASTDNHYDTMTVDEICAEPVSQVVESDAHLHLWTTNAFLRDAFRVMEAWGFTYKSCYVWVKTQMGIGNYWRVSHEFLLFGLRGTLPFQARDEMSWGEFERSRHSTKPDAIRMKVERVSPGPHLEMYGRISIPNSSWTVYGNQVSRRLF
jgi:N6-adenosine-specific RNA methylase IME4